MYFCGIFKINFWWKFYRLYVCVWISKYYYMGKYEICMVVRERYLICV